MKLDVHSIRLEDLQKIHLEIAPWTVGLLTRVTVAVPGVSPKSFEDVRDNTKLQVSLNHWQLKKKVEMFVVIREPNQVMELNKAQPSQLMRESSRMEQQDYNMATADDEWNSIQEEAEQSIPIMSQGTRTLGNATTSKSSRLDSFDYADDDRVVIVNDEKAEDVADDCLSEDEFHNFTSDGEAFTDAEELGGQDLDTVEDWVKESQGVSVLDTNYENPSIAIGAKFKDVNDLKYSLRQHSILTDFISSGIRLISKEFYYSTHHNSSSSAR